MLRKIKKRKPTGPPLRRNFKIYTTKISRNLTPDTSQQCSVPKTEKRDSTKIKLIKMKKMKKDEIQLDKSDEKINKKFVKIDTRRKKRKEKRRKKTKQFVIDSKDLGEFYKKEEKIRESLKGGKLGKKTIVVDFKREAPKKEVVKAKIFGKSGSLKDSLFQSGVPMFKNLIGKSFEICIIEREKSKSNNIKIKTTTNIM